MEKTTIERMNYKVICDKTIKGKPNFLELTLPDDIEELVSELNTNGVNLI